MTISGRFVNDVVPKNPCFVKKHGGVKILNKKTGLLLVVFISALSFLGCAASEVLVAHRGEGHCTEIDHEIRLAEKRITEIDEADNTFRDLRNVVLGGVSFIFPPLAIMNAVLFFNDSSAADFAEKDALENRHDDLMLTAENKECDLQRARVPVEPASAKSEPKV